MILIDKKDNNKQIFTSWVIRFFIIAFILFELQDDRDLILILYVVVFLFTFIPSIVERVLSLKFPFEFKIFYDLSLLASLLFEKLFSGIYVQIVHGLFFGVVGFLIMYILYYNSRIKSAQHLFAFISFCVSVSLGIIWEGFLLLLITITERRFGDIGVDFSPERFTIIIVCALIASVSGYLYIRFGEGKIENKFLSSFRKRNPKLFIDHDVNPKKVLNLIKKGENEKLEFKSTLRVNIHTNKPDKNIEYSILKTINAFLNTDGGTLLIGVSDEGNITGIEKDGFQSNDKFYQHFSNLIKNHLGNEYLPFIHSNVVQIDKKSIFKIDCNPSDKAVFIKINNDEDFYVRSGPASIKLIGKKLIDYVNTKFKQD